MNPESIRILVIEDEPQMLQNLLTILRAEKFDASGASDGERGVAAALKSPPDLILCDITMPGLDGFGVLERIRKEPLTTPIPFIFLTARGERLDVRAGMNHGADDYLTKPVKIDDLLSAIRARLQRRDQAVVEGPSTVRLPENPQQLEALGLTPRENEVLFWLIQGKANADIGTILTLSPATVKKHLEHIFMKLGVENRAAAINAALQQLSKA